MDDKSWFEVARIAAKHFERSLFRFRIESVVGAATSIRTPNTDIGREKASLDAVALPIEVPRQ